MADKGIGIRPKGDTSPSRKDPMFRRPKPNPTSMNGEIFGKWQKKKSLKTPISER